MCIAYLVIGLDMLWTVDDHVGAEPAGRHDHMRQVLAQIQCRVRFDDDDDQ